MFFVFLLYLLLSVQQEQLVFVNDSRFNQYSVKVKLDNYLILFDTLNPAETTVLPVCADIEYEIKTTRLTRFGEYKKIPTEFEKIKTNDKIKLKVKQNKMITIHLFAQDIP